MGSRDLVTFNSDIEQLFVTIAPTSILSELVTNKIQKKKLKELKKIQN